MILPTYKNVVLMSVHSLGWLLWLCFYPKCMIIGLFETTNTCGAIMVLKLQ
jgi:hypothetical protein